MNDAITEEEIGLGVMVDFYERPGDKAPTLKTTIKEFVYGHKVMILGNGISEHYPFYHFKKSISTIKYGCEITNPLDDLHARSGI